ncbi:MAG TPA: glycosyltransferase family 39 protein [Bacteroidota bacterium]|nr:glycosyltransferase family 39 protein [Bacteroidota bacterium]
MGKKNQIGLILVGLMLCVLYEVIVYSTNNFAIPTDYFSRHILYWFHLNEIQSYVWKTFLLLPLIFLVSILVTRKKINLDFTLDKFHPFILGAFVVISMLLLILSIKFVFHGTEITDDENTFDFQALTLCENKLVNSPPPTVGNFRNIFMINNGAKWIGLYTVGHPLIIAGGILLGNRYLLTIVLSISLIIIIYLIGKELYDKKTALVASLIIFTSPFFYFMSSTRLSHTSSAFFLSLSILFFIKARKHENIRMQHVLLFLSGFSIGYAFNIRQLTAVCFFLPLFIGMLFEVIKMPKDIFKIFIPFCIGGGIPFFFTLWYNVTITDNPILFPISFYDPLIHYGFGAYGHNALLGFQNMLLNLLRLNIWFMGIPISLLYVFLMLFAPQKKEDKFLFSIIACTFIGYFFYYFPGIGDVGPVYYYETIIPLSLLSARGIFYLKDHLPFTLEKSKTFLTAFILVGLMVSVGTFYSEKIAHIQRLTDAIQKPYKVIEDAQIQNAIVFMKDIPPRGWVRGLRNPSPTLDDDVLICLYADSLSNHQLVSHFPNRVPYIEYYDSDKKQYILEPFESR